MVGELIAEDRRLPCHAKHIEILIRYLEATPHRDLQAQAAARLERLNRGR